MSKRTWEDWDNLTCTAPRCRMYVKSGEGLQFIDEDGDLQRWCLKHWMTLFQEPKNVEPRPRENQSAAEHPSVQQAPKDI